MIFLIRNTSEIVYHGYESDSSSFFLITIHGIQLYYCFSASLDAVIEKMSALNKA